jgi:hypothetical protein
MFALQSSMNSKVDPDWLTARYPYLRAVVIEGAEAIEHHGWKWWKLQHLDHAQLQMELIDIWHFILSEWLLRCGGDAELATAGLLEQADGTESSLEFDGQTYRFSDLDLVRRLELLIGLATVRRVEIALFQSIMADCAMDWDELYRQYVGKNVLNFFRQDHGYKQGSYRKLWGEREDNEHLVEVLSLLDSRQDDFQQALYDALLIRYKA